MTYCLFQYNIVNSKSMSLNIFTNSFKMFNLVITRRINIRIDFVTVHIRVWIATLAVTDSCQISRPFRTFVK